MKSVQIIVYGKVQGVFFRDNTRKKAVELKLNGYARNLMDGTVEVAAEGNEHKINKLIEFIRKSPGSSRVDKLIIKQKTPQNYKIFEIKH